MSEPTAAQIAALALPGDDWETGRRRALRLLEAVRVCRPCPLCAPGRAFPGYIDYAAFCSSV